MSDPQLRNFGVEPQQPVSGAGHSQADEGAAPGGGAAAGSSGTQPAGWTPNTAQPIKLAFALGAVPQRVMPQLRKVAAGFSAPRVRGRGAGPGVPYKAPKAKKPWYKRWWVWVLGVILVWVFFSNLGGGSSSGDSSTGMRGADSQTENVLTEDTQRAAREADAAEAAAAEKEAAAAAEKEAAAAAAEVAAAEKEAAEAAAAEAAVVEPAGPTDAERSEALDLRLREIFGGVSSMTELIGALPGEWPGYVQGVRVEGDLAYFTLQVDRNTASGQQLGVDAAQALSTLFGQEDLEGINWIIVEDGTGVVIDQKQPNPLF